MQWWKLGLALFAVSLPFIIDTIYRTRSTVKQNRKKGCICKHPYIGLIDHECPYHNKYYIRYYKTMDGRVSMDKIGASYGDTQSICKNCLDKIKPRGYIIEWPIKIIACNNCKIIKENCIDIPERDLIKWKKNRK